MTVTKTDDGALKFDTAEGPRLGFPTGISIRRFSSADTVSLRSVPGIIVDSDGETSRWEIDRFAEYDGQMAALGPWLDGSVPFTDRKLTPQKAAQLIRGVRVLKTDSWPMNGLNANAVRWLADGGVLIYPPKLASWVGEISPETSGSKEEWTHPDLSGEDGWSFSLGVLAWRMLTEEDPFAGETGELRRERIRRACFPPLQALIPNISDDAARLISRALTAVNPPTLDEWDALIRQWQTEGIRPERPDAEERRRKAQSQYEKAEKRLRLRRWFRKSGWKTALITAISALILGFVSIPVRSALEKPVTVGMEPVEVAQVYYGAIDSLNSAVMDDCLARKTGKGDVRMVDTVYVTAKVRQGYEGTGMPPNASEWLENGQPELAEGQWPWGITDLELRVLPDGRISARYRLWALPGEGEQAFTDRHDVLSFAEGRHSWEIISIERTD